MAKKITAKITTSIKNWYISNFPDDEMGSDLKSVTFANLWGNMLLGNDIYDIMGVSDSVIRERLFCGIVDCGLAKDYDMIYDTWRRCSK